MKTILFYFLLAILAVSCQSKQSENTEKEVSDNVSNSDTEECIADTISATAIFWIDKAETSGNSLRTGVTITLPVHHLYQYVFILDL